MKTFFKYLLFVFALTLSQFQLSWAADFSPQNPTCPADTKSISGNARQCLKDPRDGYSCPNGTTNDGDICYKSCRDGYKSSGVATCTYSGSKSYTRKCTTKWYGGIGGHVATRCDSCRDGYSSNGSADVICWFKGTWDYARDSYTRATKYETKNVCATPGYTYNSNSGMCACSPTLTSTITASTSNAYSPKTSVTLTATATGVKACGANSISTFQASFRNSSNIEVATCTSTNGTSCSVNWNADVGTYNITSTISTQYTNNATSAAVPITVIAIPATLSVTAPANNPSYLTTSSFPLTVSTNIQNGIIDFYKNNESNVWVVCTVAAAPANSCTYTVPGNVLTAGNYSVQAKARGTSTVATPVTFTVTAPVVPTVSISSPVSGASYSPTSTITLTAGSNTAGTIDFYKNNETSAWNSCVITAPATSCSATSPANIGTGGSNTVVAKIRGTSTTSSPVAFTVGASVALTSPINNASYTRSSTIPLTATSNVPNGIVDFYKNNEASVWVACTIGGASTTSCTYTVPSNFLAAGSYSLTAKVRGTNAVSSVIGFTVTP